MTVVRTSGLCARIEEIMASRLWNKGIGSVSAVVYLQQSDSQRFTMHEMQHKDFGMPDMIGDAKLKRKTFPLIFMNFLISIISNTDCA
jgi:hypothetical protein